MKTRMVVLLTALASFSLFTLFAYCTKDGDRPADDSVVGGVTISEPTINLSGTTWKTNIPIGEGSSCMLTASFNSASVGRFHCTGDEINITEDFTYSLNGGHGAIYSNASMHESIGGLIPNNATIIIIDSTTIGIGGRVFTKQ